jgi:hypothetical protein
VRTTEDPTDPIGEFVGAKQSAGLDHFALAMYPFGLDGVQPRALLWQKAPHDPHSGFAPAVFDVAVMLAEPASYLFGDVPGSVVPGQEQDLLAKSLELFSAPSEKLGRYGTDGPPVHKPDPRIVELGHIESVAGDRFGLWAQLLKVGKASRLHQHSSSKPTVQVWGLASATLISRSRLLFSFVEGIGGGDPPFGPHPSHSQKACQSSPDGLARNPALCESLLEGDLCCHLKSPQASVVAELPRRAVQKLPKGFGATFVKGGMGMCFWREEPATRASRPRSLKAWTASRTVCWAQPRFVAICGTSSPLELAKSIWDLRRVKASLERSPRSSRLRSYFESLRTKIGGFMALTVTHNQAPALDTH